MDNPVQVILAASMLTITLMLGVMVVDEFAAGEGGLEGEVTYDAAVLDGAGTWATLNDGKGINERAWKTTGYAVNLSGASDSYVRATDPVEVASDGNWTVSLWGWADESDNMTALNIGGEIVVWYDADNSQWSAYHYDSGAREEYRVNVSDSDVVGHFTNVQVVANESHLAIYRNGTLGESKNVSTAASADAPVNSTNWDGRLEEVRAFDRALDDANRTALVDSPIEQQPGTNRTVRLMFDEPTSEQQTLLFASGSLAQSNVSFSDGFDAVELDAGSDYEWEERGPQLKPLAGGKIGTAPVAYATYEFGTPVPDIVDAWSGVVQLGAVIPMVAIGLYILVRVREVS